jgi:hypothetical protein
MVKIYNECKHTINSIILRSDSIKLRIGKSLIDYDMDAVNNGLSQFKHEIYGFDEKLITKICLKGWVSLYYQYDNKFCLSYKKKETI